MIDNIEINIEVIINEYSNYVFKIVNNIIGSSLSYQDKEEIVSDIFFLFWKNQDKINHNIKAYLGTIARNCAYQRLKEISKDSDLDENSTSYKTEFDKIIFIKDKLKTLTDDEKKIFNLYYIEGYKIKEIAKILHKRLPGIKVTLYRIREKFREG